MVNLLYSSNTERPLSRSLGCPCSIAEGGSLRKLREHYMEGIFLTCLNNLFINVSCTHVQLQVQKHKIFQKLCWFIALCRLDKYLGSLILWRTAFFTLCVITKKTLDFLKEFLFSICLCFWIKSKKSLKVFKKINTLQLIFGLNIEIL